MIFGKRASDWLPAMMSVVLAAFLLIMVALMVLNIAGSIEVNKFKPLTSKLDYDLISARILNSPNCLAYEESYVDLDSHPKTQTHAGIISYDKLRATNLLDCLGNLEFEINLEDLEGNWDTGNSRLSTKAITQEDKFFVKIHKVGESELHNGILTIGLE